MGRDLDETLDEIRQENKQFFAYIAGVQKGMEIVAGSAGISEEEFGEEIRNGFDEWLDQ